VDELAAAEGLRETSGSWKVWGVVGLLKNPSVHLPDSLLKPWQEYFRTRTAESTVFSDHAKSEPAIIRQNGLLRLRWPTLVRGRACDLDLLLATPTAPTLVAGRYPTAQTIAEAYTRANLPDYFLNNLRADIRTFQDGPISRSLIKARPEWAKRVQHLVHRDS